MSLPSSSSSLSVKTQAHNKPPSSLSSRPPSRNTARTPISAQRPPSSLSVNRPGSSASTRPQSRFSQRPNSRHARSRLVPICQTLIALVTGLKEEGTDGDPGGELFQEKVEYAVRSLETTTINKAAANVDLSVIDRQITGLALKARINSQDPLSKALEVSYKNMKTHIEQQEIDLDQDIKTAHIPDHMQFLLALSQIPTESTIEKAKTYLNAVINPPPPLALTWADILADEPFEGEHWEGIFPAPKKGTQTDEWDTTPSLSPLNSDDLALDDEDDSVSSHSYEEQQHRYTEDDPDAIPHTSNGNKPASYSFEHRTQLEELHSRQYWRHDWHTDAILRSKFNIGDPSTLGPTLNRVIAHSRGFQDAQALLGPERYIDEDDMVREILMALQGNRNIILEWREGAFTIVPHTPRLVHLSLASQESIISSLANIATTVEHLRRFASTILNISIAPISSRPPLQSRKTDTTRTCEAFADAVSYAVRGLEAWCSAREEAVCRAYSGVEEEPLVVSLLTTEKSLHDEFAASFDVLLEIIRTVFEDEPQDPDKVRVEPDPATTVSIRKHPAALTAFLLDTLFSNVQRHLERGEMVTSDALMRVFVRTAEPLWSMLGGWLKNGMGLGLGVGNGGVAGATEELDNEFFIESSGVGIGMMGLGLLDPEFWQEGYAMREATWARSGVNSEGTFKGKATPLFLEHIAELVLRTGKAIGLLRALDGLPKDNTLEKWETFAQLISLKHFSTQTGGNNAGLFSVSVDTLSRLIYDELLPHCQTISERLVKVLVEDCNLWTHLSAIEDIFLMRKGDAMSNFVDVVFTKMDTHQAWSDFHFLNTAFGDVVDSATDADTIAWVNASLVRFSYRGTKEKERSVRRTIKAIDGLVLEYAVPFPLIYIFQPKKIQVYNEIFVFLLQIRRAKSVLERILVRDERSRGKKLKEELKIFYAMRSRLSWFINTLFNFLTTYVLHTEVSRFHKGFKQMRSLDDMIQFHNDHLEKIRGRCLLKPNTSALHRAIVAILDICLQFSEGFVTFAGDTTATLDLSRQSIIMKRHRSKRQRRQRQNVIGFSQFIDEDDSAEEEEKDELDTSAGFDEASGSAVGSSATSNDEDIFIRVERMSSELDGLVKFLRRGVESLAGGTSEAAAAFGVLAFALEDWDI